MPVRKYLIIQFVDEASLITQKTVKENCHGCLDRIQIKSLLSH